MATNTWLKLTIKSDPVLVEPICDFLVGIIDAGVETGAKDELLYGTVNGYVEQSNPSQEEIDAVLEQVAAYLAELAAIFDVKEPTLSHTMIEEEDWGKTWKEHFKPFAIIPGLIIAPTWEEYEPGADELVITMDPGMAFGTGHHATTFLALGFLKETISGRSGLQVLDVGTGTGILGMASLLFGAESVLAVDNDPEAVMAAADNVRVNKMADRMEVSVAAIESIEATYSVVVANIVHDVLTGMADELARVTAPGGTLILSGILIEKQVDSILETFGKRGFSLVKQGDRQEWSALKLLKI